jgi:large subunit ribosomal protein L21
MVRKKTETKAKAVTKAKVPTAFAILETGGKQYRVEEGDTLNVELLDPEKIKKNTVVFDTVLLIRDEKDVHIGDPYVKNGKVKVKVLEQIKDKKVIIFKKRPKETYRKKTGHRQKLQRIQIEKIEIKAAVKLKEKESE